MCLSTSRTPRAPTAVGPLHWQSTEMEDFSINGKVAIKGNQA